MSSKTDRVADAAASVASRKFATPISSYITGDYEPGTNASGCRPAIDNVLVLPDTPMRKTEGDIIIPDAYIERAAMAAESGILIAVGPDAFVWNQNHMPIKTDVKPQPGDRVVFNRYSGIKVDGDDGQTYYIMTDHSVKAVLQPAATTVAAKRQRR